MAQNADDMKTPYLTFLIVTLLLSCNSDGVRPNEVKATLQGFRDDTGYNPCNGWVFEVGSKLLPANEVPKDFEQRKNVRVWLRYEKDTISFRGRAFAQCNLIRVLSIRDRK